MAEQDVLSVQAQIDANPQLTRALADLAAAVQRNGPKDPAYHDAFMRAKQAVQGMNLQVPHDYVLNPHTGRLEKKNFLNRNWEWVVPTIFGANVAAASGAIPGISGAGSAATHASAAGAVPELGMDAIPSVLGPGASESASAYPYLAGAGGSAAASGLGKAAGSAAAGAGGSLMDAALSGLAGLPALFGNRGPSAEENALTAQAQRLLQQQERRTTYQDPLFEAVTQMAYGLLPQRPGGYPGGGK